MGATWWRCLDHSEVSMHLHAKNLRIELGEDYIYNGLAFEALLREPYVDYTFPKARSLRFKFNFKRESAHSSGDVIISPDIGVHILVFVRHIKQIAPMVQKFYMDSTRNIRRLTHVDGEGGSIESMVQLARHNAPILQYLDLYLLEGDGITGLIQNADSSYVQYPCLHTLKLGTMPNMDLSRWPVFPGVLPFPCLRYLRLVLVSPFGDDTSFRGNAATLEYLDLYMTLDMATVLKRNKIFTSISHPKLQYVRLG
ncbi:hypothetical protein GGI17_005445 [Coemansia sp. S146]|nr:hypothetical protein GGI17_005445 [Coemansia sp. S146]